MDVLSEYKAYKLKAIQLSNSLKVHYDSAKNFQEQYKEITNNLEQVKQGAVIQQASIEIIKQVIETVSMQHINKIKDLVSLGLQTVFYDKKYSLEIEVVDKRNVRSAEFFLIEEREDGVYKNPLSDSVGGGVLAIVGLIIQLYYVGYFKLANIMFIDEGLSQVSEQYVPYMFQFLEELAKEKNFICVLITHDERFMSYATNSYVVSQGKYLKVKK